MKNGMKHFGEYLAAILLGLLGFASCGKLKNIIEASDMYGVPHADFKAMGTVSDENGRPIKGIQVSVRQHWHYENTPGVVYGNNDEYIDNTLFTDEQGTYQLIRDVPEGPVDVTVTFEDVDGEKNGGEFASAEVTTDVIQTRKGDKGWYGGAFEAKADAVLKKK